MPPGSPSPGQGAPNTARVRAPVPGDGWWGSMLGSGGSSSKECGAVPNTFKKNPAPRSARLQTPDSGLPAPESARCRMTIPTSRIGREVDKKAREKTGLSPLSKSHHHNHGESGCCLSVGFLMHAFDRCPGRIADDGSGREGGLGSDAIGQDR